MRFVITLAVLGFLTTACGCKQPEEPVAEATPAPVASASGSESGLISPDSQTLTPGTAPGKVAAPTQ